MAKEFNMNWGSKCQDSLDSQIQEQMNHEYDADILDTREFMVSEEEMNDILTDPNSKKD